MKDTDLRGLNPEAAKAYILDFVTSLKMTERSMDGLKAELDTWLKRVELAAAKAAADLEAAARAKVDELTARYGQLEAERDELKASIQRMREQLPILAASQRSVDADLLLAELQMLTGDLPGDSGQTAAATNERLNALSAEDALAALKRKLQGSEAEDQG